MSSYSIIASSITTRPTIPLANFHSSNLSALETLVLHLKDQGLSYTAIAKLLNRAITTVWTTHKNAIKKQTKTALPDLPHQIPISIFSDRNLSTLEALVFYLKDTLNLSFKEIAKTTKRDYQTIWTCYNRSLLKTPIVQAQPIKKDLKRVSEAPITSLPLALFNNDKLGALEATVKYLREEQKLSFTKISKILQRSVTTIHTSYCKAIQKLPQALDLEKASNDEKIISILNKKTDGQKTLNLQIPLTDLSNKDLTVLESLVSYLKDRANISFSQIGLITNRDPRNIQTTYTRVKRKQANNSGGGMS